MERIAMFASVIAYGVLFVVALLVAGVALEKPHVIALAVLVAGGSYLTQALAAIERLPSAVILALWAATVALGLWAAVLVVL